MSQTPSIGRIVHFQHPAQAGGPIAAIITSVLEDDVVLLTAFMPSQLPGYVVKPVPFAETPTPGHWSWPPRI